MTKTSSGSVTVMNYPIVAMSLYFSGLSLKIFHILFFFWFFLSLQMDLYCHIMIFKQGYEAIICNGVYQVSLLWHESNSISSRLLPQFGTRVVF